ncbi:MAG: ATPase domain-containing protein [Candidatus Accumulibacter sp. UW26]|jgi:circadian clock protein KaiC
MIRTHAIIRQLQTGVPGLDEVLGGGLQECSFNLIAGRPGCGKTTLAHQIMFGLATPERPALYFTAIGEPPLKMLRYQQQYTFFDLDKLNRSVRFVNLAEETSAGDLALVLARIVAEVDQCQPGLVFIDSFTSVLIAGQGEGRSFNGVQQFVQNLGVLMTSWQATTFLIGAHFSESEHNPVLTVTDGLIWLRQRVQGCAMVREMEIVKMRGQPSLPGLHAFRISRAGIEVFTPPRPAASAGASGSASMARLSIGVAGVDEMMGGGLPGGYVLLVAGPSGSGKSIMAAAFLQEGARLGQGGVIAACGRRGCHSHGRRIAELIEGERIGVVDLFTMARSVDEMAQLLVSEIRRIKATRVVIDSLSDFELALAPALRDDFREALARLLSALASTGATVLMTCEREDLPGDPGFSRCGPAFLADALIVQRYVEVGSRLQRAMAVVKVRGSAHSNEWRCFSIDTDGIVLGEPLADSPWLPGDSRRGGTLLGAEAVEQPS